MRKPALFFTIVILIMITSCRLEKETKKLDDLINTLSSERTTHDKDLLSLLFIKEDSAIIYKKVFYSDTIQYKGNYCFLFFTKVAPEDKQYNSALLKSVLEVLIYDVNSCELVYQKQFAQAGNFGGDPVYSIINFDPDNDIGLVLEKGDTQMGIAAGSIEVFKFVDNDFRKVLKLENVFFDNSGYVGNDTCALIETKTTIEIVKGSVNKLKVSKQIKKYDENIKRVMVTDSTDVFSYDERMNLYQK